MPKQTMGYPFWIACIECTTTEVDYCVAAPMGTSVSMSALFAISSTTASNVG